MVEVDLRPMSVDGRRLDVVEELRAQRVVTAAVRAIHTCEDIGEVVEALEEAVRRLGGRVVGPGAPGGPPHQDGHDGHVPPLERGIVLDVDPAATRGRLVVPDPSMPGWDDHLRTHVPGLVEDARRAIARIERGAKLLADADHDPLTRLLNRRAYDRLRCRLGPGDVLVLFDLDDFKAVNDTHGHVAGDQVLRIVGAVLRDQVRVNEHAIRLGGDEFLVVLQDADAAGGEHFLERFGIAWRQRRPFPVDISSGIAEIAGPVEAALEAADRQLYEQKRRRAASGSRPAASGSRRPIGR